MIQSLLSGPAARLHGFAWKAYLRVFSEPVAPTPPLDAEDSVVTVPTASVRRCLSSMVVAFYRRTYGFDFKYFADRSRVVGLTLGGPWDRSPEDALAIPEWAGLRERYVEGRPWAETSYYRQLRLRAPGPGFSRYLQKMEAWDLLFEDMRQNGYRRQSEVRSEIRNRGKATEGSPLNEIQVVVASTGEVLRVTGGGKHRYMMVQILNIAEVPVVINVWHRDCTGIKAKRHEGEAELFRLKDGAAPPAK